MNYDRRRADNPEIPLPERQRLKPAELLSIEGNIRHRLREVLLNADRYEKPELPEDQKKLNQEVHQILEQHNHKSVKPSPLGDLIAWVLKAVWNRWGAGIAANKATNMVLTTILTDFQKRKLLDRDGQ